MPIKAVDSIHAIEQEQWDTCVGPDQPFIRHGFLSALEDSGSATAETGWAAQHLVIEDQGGQILAASPLYLKSHSCGEYVFDWNWADAYERAGGRYYPKLQSAVPFTPVTGNRLLVRRGLDPDQSQQLKISLAEAMTQLGKRYDVSSIHVTFPEKDETEVLSERGFLLRTGQQFHWQNDGYDTFDDFLMSLNARKRKAIRKERRAISESGLVIKALHGTDIQENHWDAFYGFYRNTTDKKWGQDYLNRSFFSLLGEHMPDQTVLMMAFDNATPVAGALNLLGEKTLYGRNWGAAIEQKFLHFELCYYQAIEFAIKHRLLRVEAGAQGSHKIQRGYLPQTTYSAHWIRDEGFRQAIERFLAAEQQAINEDMEQLLTISPFKKGK